ncbi:MAG: sigma-54-dependent Fis family transcriptional regulator [Chlorobiaceae bacterium]|nr:sigma-54-dependent Fis family transcriptional regulator [Chlorobiaceae bacterium]
MDQVEKIATFSPMNVLIVDDEMNIRKTMKMFFDLLHHKVTTVSNPKDALLEAGLQIFDLAFVDIRLGLESGLDLVSSLLAKSPRMKIVVITAFASVDTAVEAMKRGAVDYLPKPFMPDQLKLVLERVEALRTLELRINLLQDDLDRNDPDVSLSSTHPPMQRMIELARQVSASDAVLLLLGPSGSGKTMLARLIHRWSHRTDKPFGVISCPSLSQELLESELFGHVKGAFTGALRDNPGRVAGCEGGTLFLDEIGDLPLSIQSKLLRFIQEREYEHVGDQRTRKANVRIIAATNANLKSAVAAGSFREDLYYRLNVIQITLPSLAERSGDIEAVAGNMLAFFNAQNHKAIQGFSPEVLKIFRDYGWPGNIRELRNVVERAVILCTTTMIGEELLPDSMASAVQPQIRIGDRIKLEAIEELHIRRVLASTSSVHEAAEVLEIDKATLWRKRKQFGI